MPCKPVLPACPAALAPALALLLVAASAQAGQPLPPVAAAPPTLLLISLDGVSPTMLRRGDTPHLDRLAGEGVAAAWMNPAYPTLTFPNHYSIVTGLRPDRHGIVHNTMRDAQAGDFSIKHRAAVQDSRWWEGAEPLWVTAERAGLRTAVTSWPGSEAPVRGVQPTRWSVFDASVPVADRIDRVDSWLREPEDSRPRLATLYFEHIDSAAHRHGPEAAPTRAAVRMIDAALGELVERLRARAQLDQVNIVVVSDHGLAEVPPGQHITTESMVPASLAEPVGDGAVLGFQPRAGQQAAAEEALLGRHAHHACWRRDALPPQWHYGGHPRVPPIVCQMDPGWVAVPAAKLAHSEANVRGTHGYATEVVEMRAIFLARGPAFRSGVSIPAFDNVDVYPLLADLLGIVPLPGDAQPGRLRPALATHAGAAHTE